jgi:hypothetical protein
MESLGRMWAKVVEEMIMRWLFLEQTTQGSGSKGASTGGWLSKIAGMIGSAIMSGGGGGGGGGEFIASGPGIDSYIIKHLGGLVSMHTGGLRRDERVAKLLTNEYVLRREATRSIGKETLDMMNQTGKVPVQSQKVQLSLDAYVDNGVVLKFRPTHDEINLAVATSIKTGGVVRDAMEGR